MTTDRVSADGQPTDYAYPPVTTIRVGKRHRYTSIDRSALNDRRLTFRARGVLAYLLDKPDDWKTNADSIAAAGVEGREAVRRALRELEACGYLTRKKWRNPQGQWQSEWTVLERPLSPQRETGAGLPLRVPGPQVMKTDTEDCPSDEDLDSVPLFWSGPVIPPTEPLMSYEEWVVESE